MSVPTVITLVEPHLACLSATAATRGSRSQRAVLNAMLARATATIFSPTTCEAGLFTLAGGDPVTPVAVAPVTWLHEFGAAPAIDCWRADPVHIELGSSNAAGVVFGAELELDLNEARALAADIAAALGWPGHKLVAPVAERWYVRDMAWPAVDPATPAEVSRAGLSATLPRGEKAAPLRQLMSEIQIVLSDHPLNRERALRGLPTVNSLWFWGGGRAVGPGAGCATRQLFGEDPFLGGLGRMMNEEMRPLPSPRDPGFWRDLDHEALLMLSPNKVLAEAGEMDQALDRMVDWLVEARRQLLAGRLRELRLADALGRVFSWRRFDPLRIWRRATPQVGRQR